MNKPTDDTQQQSLKKWLWVAFRQHALIPIILIESVLLMTYIATNHITTAKTNDELRSLALTESNQVADREADILSQQLQSVTEHLQSYTATIGDALQHPVSDAELQRMQQLERGNDGQLYSKYEGLGDDAAVFYSGITPEADQQLSQIAQLNRTTALMKSVTRVNPLIQQVYFNTKDSLNHIYPPFDTDTQYESTIEIPIFNFYYLADAIHNPSRQDVWTELYLDPAGSGWMLSNIAPVYLNQTLAGVAGIDITIENLITHIQETEIPWRGFATLLDPNNQFIAIPERGQSLWDMHLQTTSDRTKVTSNTLANQQFSLSSIPGSDDLLNAISRGETGTTHAVINDIPVIVSWNTVKETDWKVLIVIEESELYAAADELKSSTDLVTWSLLAGLILFYLVYFVYIRNRAAKLSRELLRPVNALKNIVTAVGNQEFHERQKPSSIREFNEIGRQVNKISRSLDNTIKGLSTSETRLRTALQGSGDVLITVYPEHSLIHVDDNFSKIVNQTVASLMTIDEYDRFIHPSDIDEVHEKRQDALESGDPVQIDYRLTKADGSYAWVQSRGQRVLSDEFGGFALVGTLSDISARKEVEQVLRKAKQASDEANRAKSKLLSSVTHELRTPLTAILGTTEIIKLKPQHQEFDRYLGRIESSAELLQQLIDDLLTKTQLESGALEIRMRSISASAIVARSIDLIKSAHPFAEKRLNVELNHPETLIKTDPRRAVQVVNNILSNALKYTDDDKIITVRGYLTGPCYSVDIIDCGPGIPEQQQHLLFEPFERLGQENSVITGTGLGLTICKDLVERMQANIRYRTASTGGSHFTVDFPLTSD